MASVMFPHGRMYEGTNYPAYAVIQIRDEHFSTLVMEGAFVVTAPSLLPEVVQKTTRKKKTTEVVEDAE